MDHLEALQKEMHDMREELKALYEWRGFAKKSISDLVALAESTGHEEHSNVKTAKRFLSKTKY